MLYNKPPENTVDYSDNHIFSWFGGQTGGGSPSLDSAQQLCFQLWIRLAGAALTL